MTDEPIKRRCTNCARNKGTCQAQSYLLSEKEEAALKRAWKRNNKKEECLFWKLGKIMDTHPNCDIRAEKEARRKGAQR